MYIQSLSPAPNSKKSPKRLGRGIGSGVGKTSGKGHKGQNARSGGGVRPGFEGGQIPLIRRLPKRGFDNTQFAKVYAIVNVASLEVFNDGDVVDAKALLERNIIGKLEKNGVKVLGNGELSKKLTVKANKFTQSAVSKIEKAGGKAEVL